MKFLGIWIVLLASIINGCISFYHPVVEYQKKFKSERLDKGKIPVSLFRSHVLNTHISQDYLDSHPEEPVLPSDWEYQVIKSAFGNYSEFFQFAESSGSYSNLRITLFYDWVSSYGHKGWCEGAAVTVGIIPCWGDLNVYHVEFQLNVGALEKIFTYTYQQKGMFWIGLLPFAWISLLTNTHAEALESTVYKFFEEGRKDGVL